MKQFLERLDFGINNYRFVILFTFLLLLSSVSLSPYTISVDGFSYLKSSEVLFTGDFSLYYTWIREPGYPLFIRILESIGGLFLVFFVQGLIVAFGISATIYSFYKTFEIKAANWKTFVTAGIASVLLAGYASTILQQAIFIGLFGLLLLIVTRILEIKHLDLATSVLVFILLLSATITAVFIGLAFALALFATLVFSGVLKLKVLIGTLTLSGIAFLLVMVPWWQIKNSSSPEGSLDSLTIGSNNATAIVTNFSVEEEIHEIFQTTAALLNIGGEFPPSSGLGLAHENRIFGTPVYNAETSCGRFLTGLEPDALWGKIETSYRDRCVPLVTMDAISVINRASDALYPLTGLALLLGLLLSFKFVPRLRTLVIPAFLVLSPYIYIDASISRYGALIIPLGSVLLVELIFMRPNGWNSKFRDAAPH